MKISNDAIELLVTLDFGPRIIRFSKVGGENLMMEDGAFSRNQDDKADIFADAFGEDLGTGGFAAVTVFGQALRQCRAATIPITSRLIIALRVTA